jgi:hypothetical protein
MNAPQTTQTEPQDTALMLFNPYTGEPRDPLDISSDPYGQLVVENLSDLKAYQTPKSSPTQGMNLAQRILHVGGRNNAAEYVEFGSIHAVQALINQYIRDLVVSEMPQ